MPLFMTARHPTGYELNAQGLIVGPMVGQPQGKPAASQLRSVPDKVHAYWQTAPTWASALQPTAHNRLCGESTAVAPC